jgi:hypothetical protein
MTHEWDGRLPMMAVRPLRHAACGMRHVEASGRNAGVKAAPVAG